MKEVLYCKKTDIDDLLKEKIYELAALRDELKYIGSEKAEPMQYQIVALLRIWHRIQELDAYAVEM